MVPPDTLQLRDLDRALPQFHEQQTASRPLSRRSTPPPEGAEPNPSALQQLHRLNRSSPNFDNQLSDVLYGKEYVQCVPTLQGNDLAWLVDYLDEALDRLNPSGPASRKCLRELRSICGARVILPTSYTLSPHSLNVDSDPFASGGYGDTYHGILNGARICVKRVYIQDGPRETVKRFYQEAVMWKRSTHPNIVPFLGVTVAPPQLVSNRMSGRTLLQYVGKRPDSDRPRVLYDVAKGLHYLHSHNVIHGGIKGANILVDGSGRACITDFGEATVVKDEDFVEDNSDTFGYTPRWAAPEVLVGGAFSKEADIFSFAMVMIEVFTGAVMFSDKPILGAMSAVVQGERPPRPAHRAFTDNLWTLMQRCWDHDPSLRPQASEVLEILAIEIPAWRRLISHTFATHERISLIKMVFSDRTQVEIVERLSENDSQILINMVDEVLDSLQPEIRRKCVHCLVRICGSRALLPKSLQIPLRYDSTKPAHYDDGFVSVWKGQHNGLEVTAKVLKVYPRTDLECIRRRFCREVIIRRCLCHSNVLPLLGVTMNGNQFVMVSEWMDDGNINEFLKKNTNVNRLELLREVTRGLVYMHDQGVIHGNLNGYNILINKSGHACLSGFDLVSIVSDQSTETLSMMERDITPWMSPELIGHEGARRPTIESDCYALGMVIYEVLSGQVPFNTCTPLVIFMRVLGGERPKRPQGEGGKLFTDGIWKLLELCWKHQPSDRASAKDVLRYLEEIPSLPCPSSNMDVDVGTDSDYQSDCALLDLQSRMLMVDWA